MLIASIVGNAVQGWRKNDMSDYISRKMVMKYLQEQQANVIIEKAKRGFVSEEVCDGMKGCYNLIF